MVSSRPFVADASRTSSAAATNSRWCELLAGPRDLGAGEGPVDLLAMVVGEAVEQRRMAPAHVGQRLDDGRVRPRPLDRRRRAVADPKSQLLGSHGHGGEQ